MGLRLAGGLVDVILGAILTCIVTRIAGNELGFDIRGSLAVFICYMAVGVGFWNRGRSPGKLLFGMKVYKTGGAPAGLGTMVLRETAGKFMSTYLCFLGYLWMAWDAKNRGWHDKIAGTVVLKTH